MSLTEQKMLSLSSRFLENRKIKRVKRRYSYAGVLGVVNIWAYAATFHRDG